VLQPPNPQCSHLLLPWLFPAQLLWRLDHGSSVSVSGIPDLDVRQSLEALLPLLGCKTAKVGLLLLVVSLLV
jgi:hypothetical protein